MSYSHGQLTDERIRATCFAAPDLGGALALGAEGSDPLVVQRARIESEGAALPMIGSPDGMTLTYHILRRTESTHFDNLMSTDRMGATVSRLMFGWRTA
ncbi:hypothetical protein [Quisquiliibacterium transsilvanicum]|uniref:Uncharacterized protein n=1 Tax=Quisquiliibacterium transsilvanicum TaxID=1549638 RepID=A0A7W8HHC3_9BURK|nr:hypothetical protein [Quisquiliibacterium transsilvanicum]MBB5271313.1 hypothetical protein [Quisquiliibacterium transsilvanicum]